MINDIARKAVGYSLPVVTAAAVANPVTAIAAATFVTGLAAWKYGECAYETGRAISPSVRRGLNATRRNIHSLTAPSRKAQAIRASKALREFRDALQADLDALDRPTTATAPAPEPKPSTVVMNTADLAVIMAELNRLKAVELNISAAAKDGDEALVPANTNTPAEQELVAAE